MEISLKVKIQYLFIPYAFYFWNVVELERDSENIYPTQLWDQLNANVNILYFYVRMFFNNNDLCMHIFWIYIEMLKVLQYVVEFFDEVKVLFCGDYFAYIYEFSM